MDRQNTLQALIDTLPHLAWVCRVDGHAEFFNARWYEYTGMSETASTGEGWRAAIHADDLAGMLPAWATALASGCDWEYRYRLRDHEGHFRRFDARARQVFIDGQAEPHWVGTSTDVEEVQVALDRVRAQEDRFRALIEHLPDAFVVHDVEGRIIDANLKAGRLTGYSREELPTLEIADLDMQFSRTELHERWQASVAGQTWESLTRQRRKDGSLVDVDVRAVCYEYGAEKLFLVLGRDATIRLQNEALLRQRGALLDLAPAIVFDLAGHIHYWSEGARRQYGFERHEAEASRIAALLHPRFPQPFEQIVAAIYADGHWVGEIIAQRKDGSEVTVLSQWTLYRDERQALDLVLEVHADIGAQKRAEAAAQAAETELLVALKSGAAGTWRWDVVHDQVYWDAASNRMLTGDEARVSGDRLALADALLAVHADDREAVAAAMRAAMQEGIDLRIDARASARASSEVWLGVQGRIEYDATGVRVALSGVVTDISARVAVERALAQSREEVRDYVQHLDAALEAERLHIARELHDELGQRLTTLKIDLHWILANHRRGAVMDAAAGERLRTMDGVIDATIEETRTLSASLRPIGLEELGLKSALETLLASFSARTGIRCRASIDGAARVPRDQKLAVFRIAQEALTNVARHSAACEVEVLLGAFDDVIRLEVRDDGMGLASDVDTRGHLGLVGMRERARAIGASLELRSEQGTSVVLEIPQSSSA